MVQAPSEFTKAEGGRIDIALEHNVKCVLTFVPHKRELLLIFSLKRMKIEMLSPDCGCIPETELSCSLKDTIFGRAATIKVVTW